MAKMYLNVKGKLIPITDSGNMKSRIDLMVMDIVFQNKAKDVQKMLEKKSGKKIPMQAVQQIGRYSLSKQYPKAANEYFTDESFKKLVAQAKALGLIAK